MMVLCGYFLIFSLPFVCSSKEFYVVSGVSSSSSTCYRNNEPFQPCGTLEVLIHIYWSQKFSKIYSLYSRFQISQNIHLNFSSHHKVEIKPWRNNSLTTLICNSDFSLTFSGIKEILVQSIQFKEC